VAPRALEGAGARRARAGAMRTLLEGLLHDHLDARDEASHRIADLVDSLQSGKAIEKDKSTVTAQVCLYYPCSLAF